MTSTKELVWREVSLQRPYDIESLFAILTHIAALTSRGPLLWEARCKDGKMRYLLGTPKWSVSRVQEVFKAHASAQFMEGVTREPVSVARRLKITKPVLPLNTELFAAMIRATLAAMTGGKSDSETIVQLVLGAPHTPSTIPKRTPDPTQSWLETMLGSVHNASAEQRRAMREKAEQYSFEGVVRVAMSGEHTATRLNNIISAMRTLESAGVHIHADKEQPEHLDNATLPWRMPLRLSVKEAACFLLLPAGEEELPGIPGLHPKLLLPPKWYREPTRISEERSFAKSVGPHSQRLSISSNDALMHTILSSPTGSGKSTTMEHLALSDIRAGRSVLILDPKASLVTEILERIPEERKNDVVVIDPSDTSPVGFNPLALGGDPNLTADSILAVFAELWSANWGIRSADILGGALNTLARVPDATLLWLTPLLTDENFRKKVLAQIHEPVAIEPFWRHYEAMRPSEQRTEIGPVLNKMRQINFRPGLRNVLGQSKPKFSLRELFTKRKVVLVPLNRGLIGAESARLLGSLIVGLTWNLALSRANIAPEKRHPVMIYIDELQDYLALPTSFSDALAQARGLGVAYTVAHQYRGQLPPDIKAGIDANCHNKIIFGLSSDDAKDMAAQAPELEVLDFMTLPRYEIYTTFQCGGKSTGWISGRTFPPSPPLRMAAELKAESMRRYGVPAEQTEAELLKIFTSEEEAQPDPETQNSAVGRKKA